MNTLKSTPATGSCSVSEPKRIATAIERFVSLHRTAQSDADATSDDISARAAGA